MNIFAGYSNLIYENLFQQGSFVAGANRGFHGLVFLFKSLRSGIH